MATYQFSDVTEIPIWEGSSQEAETDGGISSDTESVCSENSDMSYASDHSYASVSEDDYDGPERSPSGSPRRNGPSSKLSAFMKAVPAAGSNSSGASTTSNGRPGVKRLGSDADKTKPPSKSCTIPGCPNRRGPRGYCAAHSSLISAESAKRATKKLEKAKLSRLTFKQDRLKEKAEG